MLEDRVWPDNIIDLSMKTQQKKEGKDTNMLQIQGTTITCLVVLENKMTLVSYINITALNYCFGCIVLA